MKNKQEKSTPLHQAIVLKQKECIELLLLSKADISLEDNVCNN